MMSCLFVERFGIYAVMMYRMDVRSTKKGRCGTGSWKDDGAHVAEIRRHDLESISVVPVEL